MVMRLKLEKNCVGDNVEEMEEGELKRNVYETHNFSAFFIEERPFNSYHSRDTKRFQTKLIKSLKSSSGLIHQLE